MLKLENVSKIYRTEFVETRALNNFSLHVRKGEFIAVMGPSGSGKSTFLNIAGLLDDFEKGTCLFDGLDVSQLNDNQRADIRNQKIGFVFQGFNLIPDLNVFDNVDVPLRFRKFKSKERRERIESALVTVGLSGRMKHYPSQLSGGQQQRVAIARAIAGSPSIILADEPTGNLDSMMARQIISLMESINEEGTTLVMVSHDPELALRAHRQVHILDGSVIDMEAEPSFKVSETCSEA
ncbi:ABC transporter ATP-binding protein [candidate division CSSED10-310 bacterium]|uniref:ABC transporter ATP-binding protein n=1 Tax=candidate division CSSED10-310 bacterium TaxID=2855610 RepID=A0ABV6YZE7_UNCC1